MQYRLTCLALGLASFLAPAVQQLRAAGTNPATASFVLTPPSPTPPPTSSAPLTIAVTLSGSAGTPTGSVQIVLDGGTFTSGFFPLSNGSFSFTSPGQIPTTSLTAGTHSLSVEYSGDSNYALALLPGPDFLVTNGSSATTLTSPANGGTSVLGQPVTLSATVVGTPSSLGAPTGTVQFLDGATIVASSTLSGGSASTSISGLAVGAHTLTAKYAGDSNFAASTSTSSSFTVTVANTATTLTAPPNNGASVFGQPVTITAAVVAVAPGTGVPAGSVQVFDGATSLGTVTLDSTGHASLTSSSLASGAHSFTAQYGGNTNFGASTTPSAVAFTVTKASTSTNLSVSGGTLTAVVTVNAPGAGTPTGTVTFQGPNGSLGSAALVTSGGRSTATLTPSSFPSGTYTATYSGDTNFNGSTSNALTVSAGPTTLSLTSGSNPSTVGQSVTFTAAVSNPTVSGTPTGTVQFFDTATLLGSATLAANGQAVFSTSALPAGSHAIVAKYSGDSAFSASQASIGQVVNGMTSTVTLTAAPAAPVFGQTVTLTAAVGPTSPPTGFAAPTGQVIFQDGGTQIGSITLSTSEVATLTINTLSAGVHTITAVYSGDSVWGSSHGLTTVTIAALPPLMIINAAANISSSFAADEAVSAFNVAILNGDTSATLPLQTTLAGVSVAVKDSAGVSRQALIYGAFASTNQVNFVFPSNTALGSATVTITVPTGPSLSTTVNITRVSPGIFAANMNGQGVFAGQVVHVHADGSREVDSSATLNSSTNMYVANPVNLGPSTDQVFLQIYGTGLQHASNVTATVNGVSVSSVFAAQGQYPGLDQVNAQLPHSLAGAGSVDIVITADGQAANTVTVTIQ